MYKIVSFMIASILYFSAWNAAILSNLVNGAAEIICRLVMVVFILLWLAWVAEGFAQRQGKHSKRRG